MMPRMRNRWFHIPVLHTPIHGVEKKATWLELFYDLIFVAAFIQLGNGLSSRVGIDGFLGFAAIFVPLWVAWTGFTYYANRFTVDDFTHRILVFVQMFAVGGMAIFAPDVLEGRPVRFAVAYTLAQAVVALLYFRAWKQLADARDYSVYWGGVFGAGAVLWFVSIFVPAPYCYVLWAIGIGAIVTSPFSRHSRSLTERYPIDQEHLAERYGLLTLIVLGESFVKVLSSITADVASPHILGQAALTLMITCSLWWIYFDDVAGSHLKKGRFGNLVWLFAHLPMQLGITATGVAIKKAAFFDLGAPAPAKYRWLLCGALGLVMACVAVIDSVTARKQSEMSDRARVNTRAASAIVVLLLAPVGGTMTAWMFLGIVTLVCIAQVVFDMMMAPLDAAEQRDAKNTAELAREQLAEGRVAAVRPLDRADDVVRKGTPSELRRDLYFYLMEGSWTRVFVMFAFAYLMANVFFACLYLLEPGSIDGARPESFPDAFFFSVQTMATIGYGVLNPASTYGNLIVTIQAAVALIGVALTTGLMFAKASRPHASVLFSRPVVVTRFNGVPSLIFRVGNARGNDIVEASLSVSVLLDEISAEGQHLRRMHDLKLTRSRSPFFRLTWVVMHPIDDESPLRHIDWSSGEPPPLSLIAILTGRDGTYNSTVYARHTYYPEHFRPSARFVDVIHQLPDGRMMVDYEKFHDVVPDDAN